MKKTVLLFLLYITGILFLHSQQGRPTDHQQRAIVSLINMYSEAREKSDTVLLKSILTPDIDQLVSTGEWRYGIDAAVQGMLKSSGNNPGTRKLTVESIRMIDATTAIADCRYEIQNTNVPARKMWSTFIVVAKNGIWKICAIRNMAPAGP